MDKKNYTDEIFKISNQNILNNAKKVAFKYKLMDAATQAEDLAMLALLTGDDTTKIKGEVIFYYIPSRLIKFYAVIAKKTKEVITNGTLYRLSLNFEKKVRDIFGFAYTYNILDIELQAFKKIDASEAGEEKEKTIQYKKLIRLKKFYNNFVEQILTTVNSIYWISLKDNKVSPEPLEQIFYDVISDYIKLKNSIDNRTLSEYGSDILKRFLNIV